MLPNPNSRMGSESTLTTLTTNRETQRERQNRPSGPPNANCGTESEPRATPSRQRKCGNKEIIHSNLSRKLRDAALKNKPGRKTLNIVTINPDTLVQNNSLSHIIGEMDKKTGAHCLHSGDPPGKTMWTSGLRISAL